ncbi:MBL fold metallo-hydrolase [Pectobacterium polaris]|uniref:MBL fold metallo-hydrolase n=1 Tax=Pectobacterium polaris TaxID=2042057 RepID=UPI002B253DFF|nr:MBL fold metallo-hydrolase [Pectobacterium polaris]
MMVIKKRKLISVIILLLLIITTSVFFFLRTPVFGEQPEGARLERIEKSANYVNGEFRNQVNTPMFSEGNNFLTVNISYLFAKTSRLAPETPLPVVKTDLKNLNRNTDTVIWLGHSSYFIQLDGKRMLVDPVFSERASPVALGGTAFTGTTLYSVEDMPDIDYLLITHDHYDHLDYPTISQLKSKVDRVITGLGVGQDFVRWGYSEAKIYELDWNDALNTQSELTFYSIPARHYSGRALTANKTLWTGYVIESGSKRILLSGDSGYGPHYQDIAARFKHFDLVALDMGQYDPLWPYIHMTPEEASRVALELNAKSLLPAHVGRFALASHPWDDPFKRITAVSKGKNYQLLTPKIGEPIELDNTQQKFGAWWEGIN